MDFTITVNISLEHAEDTANVTKEVLTADLINRLTVINPQEIVHQNGARYTVTVWDAEEA